MAGTKRDKKVSLESLYSTQLIFVLYSCKPDGGGKMKEKRQTKGKELLIFPYPITSMKKFENIILFLQQKN
jgi:hypothetical protein